MRRFELKRGLSLRFWQVSVDGNHVTVTSGLAGVPSQPLTATFPTPEAAWAEQERLVKERLSWGYVELDPSPFLHPPPEDVDGTSAPSLETAAPAAPVTAVETEEAAEVPVAADGAAVEAEEAAEVPVAADGAAVEAEEAAEVPAAADGAAVEAEPAAEVPAAVEEAAVEAEPAAEVPVAADGAASGAEEVAEVPEIAPIAAAPPPAAAPAVPAAQPGPRPAARVKRIKAPSRRLMALPAQALVLTVQGTGNRRVRRDAMAALVAQKTPEAPAWVASCLLDSDSTIRAMAEEYFARAPGRLGDVERGSPPPPADVAERLRELKADLAAPVTEAAAHQLPAGLAGGPGPGDGKPVPFWAPEALTRPVLVSGMGAVPLDAVRSLVELLRTAPEPGPAVARWREACTGASLEAFAWSLVRAFLAAGAATEDAWAFGGLAAFGGDRTCERLGQLALAWKEEGARECARAAVATLSEIGSDAALAALQRLPAQLGRGAIASDALQGLARAAQRRGLDPESLADRLVDTLGLRPDGTWPLGPPSSGLQGALDGRVRLVLRDTSGRALSRFPRGAAEDAANVQAEREWMALKASVPRLISEQVQRLERAMASGRRWRAEDFLVIRHHPLLRAIARGLVWAAGDPARPQLFTLDPDGAPVDVRGARAAIADGQVWLAHPAQMDGAARAGWQAALSAAGRAQPFRQLDRPVRQLTPEEEKARAISRLAGRAASSSRLASLLKKGWRLGPADGSADAVRTLEKPLGSATASLAIAPGLSGRTLIGAPPQSLGNVSWSRESAPGAVEASELLLDLEGLGLAQG